MKQFSDILNNFFYSAIIYETKGTKNELLDDESVNGFIFNEKIGNDLVDLIKAYLILKVCLETKDSNFKSLLDVVKKIINASKYNEDGKIDFKQDRLKDATVENYIDYVASIINVVVYPNEISVGSFPSSIRVVEDDWGYFINKVMGIDLKTYKLDSTILSFLEEYSIYYSNTSKNIYDNVPSVYTNTFNNLQKIRLNNIFRAISEYRLTNSIKDKILSYINDSNYSKVMNDLNFILTLNEMAHLFSNVMSDRDYLEIFSSFVMKIPKKCFLLVYMRCLIHTTVQI